MKRSLVSVWLGASFLILSFSGFYAFFWGYASFNVFIHILFGWLFTIGVTLHLTKNLKILRKYLRSPSSWLVATMAIMLLSATLFSFKPIAWLKSTYQRYQAGLPRKVEDDLTVYEFEYGEGDLEIEALAGKHFFYPQVAIWTEDTLGNYLETLMVTYSTAKGVFYGGTTRESIVSLNKTDASGRNLIRVDALPYWSHKRGVKYPDGYYVPSPDQPLPDGITGATPLGNFKFKSEVERVGDFVILIEVNVAFDENEYYSEFDFADDSLYHSGAGLLGQPSLIYKERISRHDGKKYYLLEPIGHGHHSGQSGELFEELKSITTAREIFDRVMVKYE